MSEKTALKDVGSYKQSLVTSLVNDDDICSLLLNKKQYTEDEVENLLYTQIFPYLYIDDTQTETLTYLCFDVDMQDMVGARKSSGSIKNMKLIVLAYCHKDVMQYHKKGYSGTRVDILSDMVDRKISQSDKFGIGKPELFSVSNYFPNNKFYGKQLIYNIPDFRFKE